MAIYSGNAPGMLQFHDISVPSLGSCIADTAIARRAHRGTHGRGVVDALVRPDQVQDGVIARTVEFGADAAELDRRAQKGLVQAAAVGGEITRSALGINITQREVGTP